MKTGRMKILNAEDLELAQSRLNRRIEDMADAAGLSNDEIAPITDGVYDAAKYLASGRRIMWVMKEPYDEIINGKPLGGGWNVAKDCFIKQDAWSNPSWQPIIYSIYGLKYGCLWNQMDWIRDDKTMADSLQEIAYINVSKMPNEKESDDGYIGECYKFWKTVLFEQIDIYSPDVIIFANTFMLFRNDLLSSSIRVGDVSFGKVKAGDAYRWGDKLLLDVYHPNNRTVTREVYVNSIIETITNNP